MCARAHACMRACACVCACVCSCVHMCMRAIANFAHSFIAFPGDRDTVTSR